jgi:hypothetical protein
MINVNNGILLLEHVLLAMMDIISIMDLAVYDLNETLYFA